MTRTLAFFALPAVCLGFATPVSAQSLGNTGTIEGTVTDPSGAGVEKAAVRVHNLVTGYEQADRPRLQRPCINSVHTEFQVVSWAASN